jgi:glycosyltransferase involved in cell wall biosynthesis
VGHSPLHVLAVEPWLGGSHARFLEGWRARSAHRVEVLGLPARHWRWRMEGSALTLAERAAAAGSPPDVLWLSDYLDLPRFRGFLPAAWRDVPALAYFHENQLTFPRSREPESLERGRADDVSPGFANVLTAIAAELVVFNSRFHQEDFRAASSALVARLPKPRPAQALEAALARSQVIYPGVDLERHPLGMGPPDGAPLQVGWCHRWEHDKEPARFLGAVCSAIDQGADLELVLLGQVFERASKDLTDLLARVEPHVRHRGFAEDRAAYARLLGGCDLVVSTASHEFYGISSLEAAATGCAVLAPRSLAYPETMTGALAAGLYDTPQELVARLVGSASTLHRNSEARAAHRAATMEHDLARTAASLDRCCLALART